MFDFLLGVIVGSQAAKGRGVSGKAIAITLVIITLITSMAYMMLPDLYPDLGRKSIQECGGRPFEDLSCMLSTMSPFISFLLFITAALIALAVYFYNKND